MSTTHFESTLDLEMLQPLDLRPKMRTYQIKIKQKRSELDDYELSIFTFIKDKQSVKEDLEK